MTSLSVLRSCGFVGCGALGYELYRQSNDISLVKSAPIVHEPSIVVNTSSAKTEESNLIKYGRKISVLATCLGTFLYYMSYRKYITPKQFYRAFNALQTQISGVSKALVRVKDKVLDKFGLVEKRLDDIERTLLTKTAEIRRDLANVETMLSTMSGKVDAIEERTRGRKAD